MGIVRLGNDWDQIIGGEFKRDYYRQLRRFLLEEYSTKTIYPDQWDIFAALRGTSYRDCKVVILGQDPTTARGKRTAWLFGAARGVPSPPSLRNILKNWPMIRLPSRSRLPR